MLNIIDKEDRIKIPRLVSRKKYRTNVSVNCSEEYFHIVIADTFYNDVIQHTMDRFSNHKKVLFSLYLLIPKMCSKIFIDIDSLSVEMKLWNKNESYIPETIVQVQP